LFSCAIYNLNRTHWDIRDVEKICTLSILILRFFLLKICIGSYGTPRILRAAYATARHGGARGRVRSRGNVCAAVYTCTCVRVERSGGCSPACLGSRVRCPTGHWTQRDSTWGSSAGTNRALLLSRLYLANSAARPGPSPRVPRYFVLNSVHRRREGPTCPAPANILRGPSYPPATRADSSSPRVRAWYPTAPSHAPAPTFSQVNNTRDMPHRC